MQIEDENNSGFRDQVPERVAIRIVQIALGHISRVK
jgi:hypothetical protein